MLTNEEVKHAAIGAVVTILTSFVPLSPILGGAVAAYLHGRDGPRIGALSGGLAAIPFVGFGFVLAVLFGGASLLGGLDVFAFSALLLVVLLVGLVFAVAITAVLGAVGGWIGIYVLEETDIGGRPATPTQAEQGAPTEPGSADETAEPVASERPEENHDA